MGYLLTPSEVGKSWVASGITKRLLDDLSNVNVAVATRRLNTNYTGNALRVRRASDSTETNIGFTSNGLLDTAAITSFCGTSDGFVSRWYDQSGNSRDLLQTTATAQPRIYTGSTQQLITLGSNNLAALQFSGSQWVLRTGLPSAITFNSVITALRLTNSITTASAEQALLASASGGKVSFGACTGFLTNELLTYLEPTVANTRYAFTQASGSIDTATRLIELYSNGASSQIFMNGGSNLANGFAGTPITFADTSIYLGATSTGTAGFNGVIGELILFGSNQAAQQTLFQQNINAAYALY